ncbi:MAG: hypothetical protein O9302_09010 [Cyclobacteriaceae bacterium]|jgi:hypothetical protein|nr:hypothetical protein [Flammeovirgaceae bacterium]MCZ8020371.1 hypothetical protein [Cytophagales bacterium]MCZ8328184.1 hypothetical protein [Cyclobacteriaceae bacterium]
MINQLLRLYGRWLPIALTSTCLAVVAATAQNTPPPAHAKKRSIETHIGYQNQQFKETQQSSIFRQANGISINVAYTTVNGERNQTIGLYYSQTKTDKNFASFANNKFGGIFYNHVRAIHKNIHVGGYADAGVFYTYRDASRITTLWGEPGTNFSYAAWSSVGLSASFNHDLKKNWSLSYSVRLPLLAYTIRPFYVENYPTAFLRDGRFSFNEEGIVKDFFKSGKVQSINNFMNVQASLEILKRFGTRQHQIGLQYQAGYLFFNGLKPLANLTNQILLTTKINISKP